MTIPPSDIAVTGPTILGKEAAGAGVAEEISPTDATAMLDEMVGDSGSGGTKGLVPAPAAGDAAAFKFLMADGTWASPLPDTIAAVVYLDTDQTLTDNLESAISFTDELFDTDSLWASSPNPTRLTAPSDGIYAVRGKIAVDPSFIGLATVRINANGTMAASVSEPHGITPDAVAGVVYLDTDQTLTNNVETTISFTDELFDTDGLWASSPNPTRLTAPEDGVYMVRGKIALNSSFVGAATVRIYKNGTMVASVTGAGQNLAGNNESHEVSALIEMTAGEYVELKVLLQLVLTGSHDVTGGDSTVTLFSAFKVAAGGGGETTTHEVSALLELTAGDYLELGVLLAPAGGGASTHDVMGGDSTVTVFSAFKVASQGGGAGGGNITTADVFASRPAAGIDGNLFFPTDAFQIQRDNGAAWKGWGPIYPFVTPDDTGFSWVNQGGASLTVEKDSLLLVGPADTTDNFRGRVKSASAPYTIDAAFTVPFVIGKPFFAVGMWWRESGSGKLSIVELRSLFGVYVSAATALEFDVTKWNSPTSFNATYVGIPCTSPGNVLWIRLVDDSTNRKVFIGSDGETWTELHSVSRTDFLTPDQVGFCIRSQNQSAPNLQMHTRLLSWNQF